MRHHIVVAALAGFTSGCIGAWAWQRFERWRTVRKLTRSFLRAWERDGGVLRHSVTGMMFPSDPEGFVRPYERGDR